jgi:hypothetical protein
MKTRACRGLIAIFFALFLTTNAQTLRVTRDEAAYHPENTFDPATLLSPANFLNTESGRYVVVEGFIDYYATTWPENDGDYHFEMQSTNAEHTTNPVDGLVCEIDPVLQLEGAEALKDIDQHDQSTYRKARVYGWLRFGTESNHAGVQDYDVGNGKTVSGHWEIHPVEKVETIDEKAPFKIGPEAEYVKWPKQGKGSIIQRYKVTDDDFADADGFMRVSNYAKLIGNVKHIKPSSNGSGDIDVDLEVNSDIYTATIPQYYIESFDADSETVKLKHLAGFKLPNYTLKPSDTKVRTFYGLRNWRFSNEEMNATLAPVEMIK